MNKRFFTLLMVLMGTSILGIIAIQLIWINQAMQVRNELFDRSVNQALTNTAHRMETQHDVQLITGIPRPGQFHWQTKQMPTPPIPPRPVKIIRNSKSPQSSSRIKLDLSVNDSNVHIIELNQDSTFNLKNTHSFISKADTIYTTTTALVKSTIVKLDSIETIVDTLSYFNPQLKQRLQDKSKNLKNIGNRVIREIIAFEDAPISIDQVNSILKEELQNQNINLSYDAAILEQDTITSMTAQADSLALSHTPYQTNLFPQAIFDRNTQLALFFPTQNRYIYRSVSWLLAASFIFSLFILTTFGLTIFFMLKQKKISEMKSDFINNMTHEFKTPIATISVAADSIKNEKVIRQPDKINYFIDMIKKENFRMNRQVEDILTIARLDKKEFDFKWEPINLHHLIEDAIESIILQVEKRGGKIETELQAVNPTVTTDRTHCANIIYNLLDNANKYSEDSPQIKLETHNNSKGVIIRVSDKGIGMSKSVQGRIFERFYRQTSGNIHNVKGFGLGLSYVKAIVEANQGTISVHSELGKGSQFEVFLPFMRG
ncbi:sensor histidine kinase [Sunxiuqinia rutila]|uniref:sensor histidine kinase n=1 Tax=Sunxiuqinia rutila TaxID=1397841 RepID=UPI003D367295